MHSSSKRAGGGVPRACHNRAVPPLFLHDLLPPGSLLGALLAHLPHLRAVCVAALCEYSRRRCRCSRGGLGRRFGRGLGGSAELYEGREKGQRMSRAGLTA